MFQLPWHLTFLSDWIGSVGHYVLHIIHIVFYLVMPLLISNKLLFKHFFRNNNLCSILKLFASYIWHRFLSCRWQLILENFIVACRRFCPWACSLCFVYDSPWAEYKKVTYIFFLFKHQIMYHFGLFFFFLTTFFQQTKMRKTQVYCVPSWNGIDNSYCNLVPTSTVVNPWPVSAKHPWIMYNSYMLLLSFWPGHSKPLMWHFLDLFFLHASTSISKFNIQF